MTVASGGLRKTHPADSATTLAVNAVMHTHRQGLIIPLSAG